MLCPLDSIDELTLTESIRIRWLAQKKESYAKKKEGGKKKKMKKMKKEMKKKMKKKKG